MLFAYSIPKVGSYEVGDPWEGVLDHFYYSLGDKVVSDKGVVEMTALDNFSISKVDEDELVEN